MCPRGEASTPPRTVTVDQFGIAALVTDGTVQAGPGPYWPTIRPRRAVVVQGELFEGADPVTGIEVDSYAMVDALTTVHRSSVGERVGHPDEVRTLDGSAR
jgi:hypothetical protein